MSVSNQFLMRSGELILMLLCLRKDGKLRLIPALPDCVFGHGMKQQDSQQRAYCQRKI